MIANFKFHPVGQGCFYTGVIGHGEQKFVMVYDCGSVTSGTYLDDAIIDFCKDHDYIDLLVISHLDKDHFNGVQKLLRRTRVGRIVLPYLSLMERLAILASTKKVGKRYRSFLTNPVIFLKSQDFRIDTISFIEAAPKEDLDVPDKNESDENKKDKRTIIQPNQIDLFGDIDTLRGFEEDRAFRSRVEEEDGRLLDVSNVSFLPFNTSGTLYSKKLKKDIWEFVFYHRKLASSISIGAFQKAVNNYLATNDISTSYDLFDKKHVKELKKLYPKYLKLTTNRSSICLYHGALEDAYTRGNICSTSMWYGTWWYPNRKILNKLGTLLTGDQELKSRHNFKLFCN